MQQELGLINDEEWKDNVNNFFKWVKGTELVELDDIDVSEDIKVGIRFRLAFIRTIEKSLV